MQKGDVVEKSDRLVFALPTIFFNHFLSTNLFSRGDLHATRMLKAMHAIRLPFLRRWLMVISLTSVWKSSRAELSHVTRRSRQSNIANGKVGSL